MWESLIHTPVLTRVLIRKLCQKSHSQGTFQDIIIYLDFVKFLQGRAALGESKERK